MGARLAGRGPATTSEQRAAVRASLESVVRVAEEAAIDLTLLRPADGATRARVMGRGEWIGRNVDGFRSVADPFAARLLGGRSRPGRAHGGALGVQLGAVLGYVGRKVLGQYDLFVGPEDRNVVYFVGPNIVEFERRNGLEGDDFRMWIALHEVTHRLQFGGVPWLRDHLLSLIDEYLRSMELRPGALADALRRVLDEIRHGTRARGLGLVYLLMSPEQREVFRRVQALMSLLEGHASFVMNALAPGRVRDVERMREALRRRRRAPMDRAVQRAIGLDAKVRQYDAGERFVSAVIERAGAEGFGRVWEQPENIPTLEEIERPGAWLDRVLAAA